MSRHDWYRRTTWSPADQDDFHSRLQRAKRTNRAQYLRIQASHLAAAGGPDLTAAALALLDLLFSTYPDPHQLAMACCQRAECLLRQGEWTGAADAYRTALEAERRQPLIRSNASIDFPWAIVSRGLTDLFDEAARILDQHGSEPRPFPIQRFKYEAMRAILAEWRGEKARSAAHAREALEAAHATSSGFARHPGVGLVTDVDPELRTRLERLS